MTFSDYLIDLTLIGLVLLQIRGRPLTNRSLLLPLAIVAYVAIHYLKTIPTSGNDLGLIGACVGAGVSLGIFSGWFTAVYHDANGTPMAKAGLVAATLWVLGTGGRFAFQFYATHGGAATIERFSVSHSLSGTSVWATSLILMAICEVVGRTVVLATRRARLGSHEAVRVGAYRKGRPETRPTSILEVGEENY
ncbi:MAG: hypothetical protein HKL87_02185 [Acidimicrobiaceae bacterium]|nr:hypothetical protein [Acidimicrobiaceae bacterium]